LFEARTAIYWYSIAVLSESIIDSDITRGASSASLRKTNVNKLTLAFLIFGAVLFRPLCSQAGMRMKLCIVEADKIPAVLKSGSKLKALLAQTNELSALEIDKAWHGIHYLLAGSDKFEHGTASLVIFGGKDIGGDLGYGPARFLSPSEVKDIAKLLKDETPDKLSARYDPKKMQKLQIYPEIWEVEGKEAFGYLMEYYRQLVAFYAKAAKGGHGVILVIW